MFKINDLIIPMLSAGTCVLLKINDSIHVPVFCFNAEEWVTAGAQPIGIGQCLRLTPMKLAPVKPSIKKKSFNSLCIGFKKICSAGVCLTCQLLTISATNISAKVFHTMSIVSLSLNENL